MRSYLIGEVLKAIVERWPHEHAKKHLYLAR
jgi:hypothetical protein